VEISLRSNTAYKEFNITVEVTQGGKSTRFPAYRDQEVLDQHGLRPGFEQRLGRQAKTQTVKLLAELRARFRRASRKTNAHCLGLPGLSQWSTLPKGASIALGSKNARPTRTDLERPTKETSKYLVSYAKDADLNQGDGQRLDGA